MDQQITLSKEIVPYLASNLPSFKFNNAMKCIKFIEQNYIVCDNQKKHFLSIVNEIDKLDNEEKRDTMRVIFDHWMREKNSFVETEEESMNEISLAEKCNDKIYFNPLLPDNKINKLLVKYSKVESHNEKTFLSPLPINRLKHAPTIIPLVKNTYYNLYTIIEPFIRGADEVKIIDPYLPNPNASNNLFNILPLMKNKKITLSYLKRDKYIYNDDDEWGQKNYDDFDAAIREKIRAGYLISLKKIKVKKHRERYIVTDRFNIYLPGGLDFLDNNGFPKIDLEEIDIKEIRITEKDNI